MVGCINPQCNFAYSRKTKPEFCPTCSVYLGGSYIPKAKKAIPVINDVVPVGHGIFSVRYHQDFRSLGKFIFC